MSETNTFFSVLVCDDHPIFRNGVIHCLNEAPYLKVVAEASDIDSAIAKLQIYKPDILVSDLSMPGGNGFELLRWVQANMPSLRAIVLSMHTELSFVSKAKALGASAFLAKEDAETDLLSAVRSSPSEFFTSGSIGKKSGLPAQNDTLLDAPLNLERVSVAEMKVLQLLSQSLTSKEIARALNISPRTVEAHRSKLAEKLDAKGPNRLLELAILHRAELQLLR